MCLFLRSAELSRINHWVFLQTLGEAGEVCWELDCSGQGCPAKRWLQPVLGTEEQGTGPRGVSSPGVRLQAARSAKPSRALGSTWTPSRKETTRSTAGPGKGPFMGGRGPSAALPGGGRCSGVNWSVNTWHFCPALRWRVSHSAITHVLGAGCSPDPHQAHPNPGVGLLEVEPSAPTPLPGVAQRQGEHLGRLWPPCQSTGEICNVPVLKK